MQIISVVDILKLYPILHEAAEDKFVDTVNSMIRRRNVPTQLQKYRKSIGYSQRELTNKSGVSLRIIQQYEQRLRNINNATGANLFVISKALDMTFLNRTRKNWNSLRSDPNTRYSAHTVIVKFKRECALQSCGAHFRF